MKRNRCLSEREAKQVIFQLCQALKVLHDHHIIHRDIKLENIMLRRMNDLSNIVLIDLGLARVIHYPNQNLTISVGTTEYKSPEVVSGNVQYSYAADIWSLTCTIYAM